MEFTLHLQAATFVFFTMTALLCSGFAFDPDNYNDKRLNFRRFLEQRKDRNVNLRHLLRFREKDDFAGETEGKTEGKTEGETEGKTEEKRCEEAAMDSDNFGKVLDKEIDKSRVDLENSMQTKERSQANAIQGSKEAKELAEAKAGNFDALSPEAKIEKKYIHEQHWIIPGTSTPSS